MKRLLGLLAVATVAATIAGVALAARSATRIGTGIVVVETDLGYAGGNAEGTGIVLTSKGEILTNNHVIRGATSVQVVDAGHTYTGRVVGYSVTSDIAVVQLNGASNLKTATLGNSATLRTGASVTAIGNAGGTGRLVTSTGSVTALAQAIDVSDEAGGTEHLTGLIQTDAGLQPGDSGGPLEDSNGRVVGIDTAASSQFVFAGSSSEGYAIPINRALTVSRQIESGKATATVHIGPTAFIGVQIASNAYFPGDTSGAVVAGVVPGSPADNAGITNGDVITSFAGTTVTTPQSLSPLVLRQKPGAQVQIVWLDANGNSQSATITLATGPPQ